jgi:hypothetical protein
VVALGACGSEMPAVVGVFTGDEYPPLALGADFNTGGPECSRQVIFRAVAGTVYDIGADGESFYIPGTERPSGEGTINLRIAALAPPPDDAFAAAMPLSEQLWELPSGERQLLGSGAGYNWGATTEPGEPLATGGAGASIWFRWTPRESGRATISTLWGYVAPPGGEPWMGNVELTLGEFLASGPGSPVDQPSSQGPADPDPAPADAPPTVGQSPDKPRASIASHRSHRLTKAAKGRCTLHRKRRKTCSPRARSTVPATQRRHHAAG